MANSERILTTHVGSLPRPPQLIELAARRDTDEPADEATFERELETAVADAVRTQRSVGIDVVGDGEFGHPMGEDYDYGPWLRYVFERLGGVEITTKAATPPQRASDEIALGPMSERRDWMLFGEAYGDPHSGVALPAWNPDDPWPVVRGPITYAGQRALTRDIANFKAALTANGLEDGFLNAVGPASCARLANEHYATDEELLYACADAMREEYTAIIDAGLMLQIDDPVIADNWDQINPAPPLDAYRRFTSVRIDALNHAIRDLPERAHPLPPLLGKLARAARNGHPARRHHRPHARGQRRRLLVRGGQCPPRARVARLAGVGAAGGDEAASGRGQPCDERRRAPGARGRPHLPLRRHRRS